MPNFVIDRWIDSPRWMDGKMHGWSREGGMERWRRTLLKDANLDFIAVFWQDAKIKFDFYC